MFTQSLRGRHVSHSLSAFAALLLPSVVHAQAMPKNAHNSISASFSSGHETRSSVVVMVDYVEASLPVLTKASRTVAAGPQHDTQLLAALVKYGAADTKGVTVRCVGGGTVDCEKPVSLAVGATGSLPLQFIASSTKAAPHFNADGTITITLGVWLDTPSPADVPRLSVSATPTFRDGQTLELQRLSFSSPAGERAHLVFVRAAAIKSDPAKSSLVNSSSAQRPFAAPWLAPPCVDPGMIGRPQNSYDQNMAGGRGLDPERLDHMNAWPAPVLDVPKRK